MAFSLTSLVAAAVGAGLMFTHLHHKQNDFPWYQLDNDSPSYTNEAFLESDIQLPNIKNISGQAKFRNSPGKFGDVELGYVMEFDIDKLDRTKLPEKYRKPTVDQSKQGPFTLNPIEEVVYVAKFDFTLQDKDGFELKKFENEGAPYDRTAVF